MYPVIYLVLFGPLLDGAIKQAGAGVSAYNWFVPGLLIQVALFGTAFGGFGLIAELRYGVVERMRVTPMSRTAMLLGRSLRDVVILLFQALIMIGLAIPFGLHIDVAGVVVTLGLLALIGLVVAPLSYAAALILKSEDAFAPLVQSLVMPLLLLSGILLPMALAPDWLKFLSNLNPLTHATDAARALFNSDWGNPEIRIGVRDHRRPRGVRDLDRVPNLRPRERLIVRSSLFTTTPAPWGTPASFRVVPFSPVRLSQRGWRYDQSRRRPCRSCRWAWQERHVGEARWRACQHDWQVGHQRRARSSLRQRGWHQARAERPRSLELAATTAKTRSLNAITRDRAQRTHS